MNVFTRSGLKADVAPLPEPSGVWTDQGYVHQADGSLEGPHLWRAGGQFLETDQPHDLDLMLHASASAHADRQQTLKQDAA